MSEKVICREKGKDAHFKVWHSSDEVMFIYTESDGGSIVCQEKAYPIKKGVLCFIGANKYHYTLPSVPEKYVRSKVFISSEKFNKIISLIAKKDELPDFSDGAFVYSVVDEKDCPLIEKMFSETEILQKENSIQSEAAFISLCLSLIAFLHKYSVERVAGTPGIMGSAIDYINQNIFKDISIDKICSAISVTKYHFCRKFKENMGMTVMEYILKTRIALAKDILAKEGISVSEVSSRCGFSSISYFCRVFKQETGLSPLNFRRQA